jgi:hypothetical protein
MYPKIVLRRLFLGFLKNTQIILLLLVLEKIKTMRLQYID